MSHLQQKPRLSAYASTSKVALGGALAMVPFASADVVHYQLDTTSSLSQGSQETMTTAGSGLQSESDTFSASMNFNRDSNGPSVHRKGSNFGPPLMHFDFSGTGVSYGEIHTDGSNQILGESTIADARNEGGSITLPSQTGLFFLGFQIKTKRNDWYGFIAIDLVSSTKMRIDQWAIQTEDRCTITTTLPSTGDPVPGIGGIAALALGARGVRRSRRCLA